MKTAVVVTVGSPMESLGAMKLARWLARTGFKVSTATSVAPLAERFNLYCFSVVFSWRLWELIDMVNAVKDLGEVWIGGPAVTFHAANAALVEARTGIRPSPGVDERFENEPGAFPMVYFSRGCPAYTPACGLCPVPRLEGNDFRFLRDSEPAKLLLDNNLSALPDDYQDFIVRRYAESWAGGRVDANSGFEPHTFTARTFERWHKFPLLYWRFGYDDTTERDQAREMMRVLKFYDVPPRMVRVYTMIGNESKDACRARILDVIEHGFYPWPQRLRPLDWLGPDGTLPTRFDWDEPTLIAYQRYYSLAGLWNGKDEKGARRDPATFFYQGRYPLALA